VAKVKNCLLSGTEGGCCQAETHLLVSSEEFTLANLDFHLQEITLRKLLPNLLLYFLIITFYLFRISCPANIRNSVLAN
jgi:hypothetical protein